MGRPRDGRARTLGALAALLLVAGQALGSNGAMPITSSPRAAGRGGAEIATGDDAHVLSLNPAAIMNVPGSRIDLAASLYVVRVGFTDPLNRTEVPGRTTIAPAIGAVIALGEPEPRGKGDAAELPLDDGSPFRVGLSFGPFAGGDGTVTYITPLFPEGEREKTRLRVLGITGGLSCRVASGFALGFSISGLWATIDQAGVRGGGGETEGLVRNFTGGQVNAQDEFFLVNNQPTSWSQIFRAVSAPNSLSSSRIEVDGATGFGIAASIGAVFQPTPWLSLGLSYRTPGFFTDLDGDGKLDATRATSAASPSLNTIQASFLGAHLPDGGTNLQSKIDFKLKGYRLPGVLGAGVGIWPHPRVLFALDLKWIDWAHAFDRFSGLLMNIRSRDLTEIASNQQKTTIRTGIRYEWRQQWVVATGVAFAPTDWLALRAGYNYGSDPVPVKTQNPFVGASVEHHATAGVGLHFHPVTIDVAYGHAFLKSKTIRNSVTNAGYNGTRTKATQDFVQLGASIDF